MGHTRLSLAPDLAVASLAEPARVREFIRVTTPDRLAAALADRYRLERALGAGGMATV